MQQGVSDGPSPTPARPSDSHPSAAAPEGQRQGQWPAPWPRRIAVVGCSGSGKSTAGQRVAAALGLPLIELDALYWGPNWTPVPDEVFAARLAGALALPGWVIVGNYERRTRNAVQDAAEAVLWLDLPLWRCFWRALRRTLWRAWSQEALWGGTNRESFRKSFLRRDSILLWVLTSHAKTRAQYQARLAEPGWRAKVWHCRTPAQVRALLGRLPR